MVNYSSELFEASQISKCIFTLVLTVVAVTIIVRNKGFFFKDKMNLDIVAPVRKEVSTNYGV